MPALVLDSEAVSLLVVARPGSSLDRLRARLQIARDRGWPVRVPSVVLAELYRTPSRAAAVDAALVRFGIRPLTTGRETARHIGVLLEREGLDTCHLVDAAVVATTIRTGGGVIVTADSSDLSRLAGAHRNIAVASV